MLLSAKVTAMPKVDKAVTLQSYIKTQQQNTSAYALEGKIFQASWDDLARPADTQRPSSPKEDSGFRTPTLKPRALKPKSPPEDNPANIRDETTGRDNASKKTSNRRKKKTTTREYMVEELLPRRAVSPTKSASVKKRVRVGSTDEEHEDRLAQRRTRKRTKRDIMSRKSDAPKQSHSITRNDEDKPSSKTASGSKNKKDKKVKLPAGLALLNGFSASNIGQKRLTLKPGASLGVFNKGKASANTKVNKKFAKRVSNINIFSEAKFLNSTRRVTGSAHSAASPYGSGNNSSVITSGLELESEAQGISKRKTVSVSNEGANSALLVRGLEGTSRTERSLLKHDDRESEVWEIEKENGSLVSDTSTASRPRAPQVASTVIVNTRDTTWGKNKMPPDVISEVPSAVRCGKEPICPSESASLRPSQSASQLSQKHASALILVDAEHTASRFFSHSAIFQPTRRLHPDKSQLEDAIGSAIPFVTVSLNDSVAPPENAVASPSLPSVSCSKQQIHKEGIESVLDQAHVSACGTVDSLEEELLRCAADDYVLDIPPKSNTNRHLTIAPTVSTYYQLDCNDKSDEFTLLNPYDDMDTETNVDVGVEAGSDIVSDGEEGFVSMVNSATPHPGFDNDSVVGPFGEVYLLHEHDCSDVGDVDLYQENMFCDIEEERPSNYYDQDNHGSSGESLMLSDGVDEDEDISFSDDVVRLQYEVMSDWNDQSDVDTSLAEQHFAQGRALLLGLVGTGSDRYRQEGHRTTTMAEEEVARNIKGHWLPQRL